MLKKSKAFDKSFRIKKKGEIKNILCNGKKVTCEKYKIIFTPNCIKNDRIAILVSRKVGNAIKRNRIKRKFREIFRKAISRDPPYFDILIQIRPGIEINRKEDEICFREWMQKSKTN